MRRQCEIDVIKAKRKINYFLKESFLIENALCVVSSKTEKSTSIRWRNSKNYIRPVSMLFRSLSRKKPARNINDCKLLRCCHNYSFLLKQDRTKSTTYQYTTTDLTLTIHIFKPCWYINNKLEKFIKTIRVNLTTVLAEEPTNLLWCPKTEKAAGLGIVHKITRNFINNTEHDSLQQHLYLFNYV